MVDCRPAALDSGLRLSLVVMWLGAVSPGAALSRGLTRLPRRFGRHRAVDLVEVESQDSRAEVVRRDATVGHHQPDGALADV